MTSRFKQRLFEKTASSSTADDETFVPTPRSTSPLTSPGRVLNAQIRISEADEAREAAERARDAAQHDLAEALSRIKALEAGGTNQAGEIEISTLVEMPGRRRVLSAEQREELRANLANNPLVYPIVYRPLGDGRNEIIAGHNRVSIYRDDLNRSKILGIPFNGTPEEVELGAAWSNLLAPSLPDFEKYRQFQRILKLTGMTQTRLVEGSGLSPAHISRILSFDRLSDVAKALLESQPHRLGGNAAGKLALLSEQGHSEQVETAIKALVEDPKMTQEQAVTLATPKRAKAAAPSTTSINVGNSRKKLCDVSIRNGVIGVRFAGKDSQAMAEQWGEKIAEFIRQQSDSPESS